MKVFAFMVLSYGLLRYTRNDGIKCFRHCSDVKQSGKANDLPNKHLLPVVSC